MNSDSEANPSCLSVFLEQKRRYRSYAKDLSLSERLRQLESLQEQSYEILRIREENGGKPIPPDWRRWAEAQSDIGLKK
jgi:hypothetical protein